MIDSKEVHDDDDVMLADELWERGVSQYCQAEPEGDLGLQLFLDALKVDGSIAERHVFVGSLLRRTGRRSEAALRFEAAIVACPESSAAFLELMLMLEADGRNDEARAVASRAIKAGAKWTNEWQRPPIFVSALCSQAWWDKKYFLWCEDIENNFPTIREEMHNLCDMRKHDTWLMPSKWEKVGERRAKHDGAIVSAEGEWREYVLFGEGDSYQKDLEPDGEEGVLKTRALLQRILPDAVGMAKMGIGEIIFSALAPRTHLKPHCASNNMRLTCHLGLLCPDGARMRVGSEWRDWQEGKCTFFDDSYEHEVVNESDYVRIVLLIRFWHPDLHRDDRLSTFEAELDKLDHFHQQRKIPPVKRREFYSAKEHQVSECDIPD